MRLLLVFAVLFSASHNNGAHSSSSPSLRNNITITTNRTSDQPQMQIAKKISAKIAQPKGTSGNGTVILSASKPIRKRQASKGSRGLDQEAASSGSNSHRRSYHQDSDKKPKKYSYSYDSGPQYYESTSKPVKYYREYHSPPSSYSQSYNSGPQGGSYSSPPQQSGHRGSYNHQEGNEYSDGDEYGGDDYGASNYVDGGSDHGSEYGNSNDHGGDDFEHNDVGDHLEY